MSLLPKDHFWFVDGEHVRAARIERRTDLGFILTVYRNNDDAWRDTPMVDSYFVKTKDIMLLEGCQDCPSCYCQECLEDTPFPRQSGSLVFH
jgi:hypothetical protein